MNKQEMLEVIMMEMRNQRAPSFSWRRSSGRKHECLYRGRNGIKCAVGHLIPDSIYNSVMEHNPISKVISVSKSLRQHFFGSASGYDEELIDFLTEIQFHHDNWVAMIEKDDPKILYEKWEQGMREIAVKWDLKFPEIEQNPEQIQTNQTFEWGLSNVT